MALVHNQHCQKDLNGKEKIHGRKELLIAIVGSVRLEESGDFEANVGSSFKLCVRLWGHGSCTNSPTTTPTLEYNRGRSMGTPCDLTRHFAVQAPGTLSTKRQYF